MVVRSQSEINELLWKRDLIALREMFKNWFPSAVARVMTELDTEDQMIVCRILPRELAAEAVESLDLPGKKEWLLKAMGQEERTSVLNNVAHDDRTLLLGELPRT